MKPLTVKFDRQIVIVPTRGEMGVQVVQRKFSDTPVRRSLFRILSANVLCSMATVGRGGQAHINTAYFAYSEEPELFFASYPNLLHCRNLLRNSSMALTVFESAQVWGKPDRGVQLFGTCRQSNKRSTEKAEFVYGRRFPGFSKWKEKMKKEEGEFSLRFYRFVPKKAKILDEKEFGAGIFVVVPLGKPASFPHN